MSISALVVFALYLLGLVLAFTYQAIFGLFSYLWIFYNDPQTHWWGADLPQLRYSLFAALAALLVAAKMKDAPPANWSSSPAAKTLIFYAVWAWLQTPWAINAGVHLDGAILFTKYAILSYVIYRIASTKKNLEGFLWAHVIGCFLFGWEAYRSNVNGRLETVGGPGVDDANLLAAHMITGLVVAGFFFVGLRGVRRWAAFLLIPFILNAIILTQSRGGFLSIVAAGFAALYLSPKVYRRMVSVAIAIAVVSILVLGNAEFWERVSTVFAGKESTSKETRVQLIGPQFKMFLDHPFGVGHRGNEQLSRQYMPPELMSNSGTRAAHNTFMAVLVDHGFPGAFMLLFLYGWQFSTLRKLKRLDALGLPPILGLYRAAIGAGLASFFISGLFLNLIKTEVNIWLLSLLAALWAISNNAIAKETTAVDPRRNDRLGSRGRRNFHAAGALPLRNRVKESMPPRGRDTKV